MRSCLFSSNHLLQWRIASRVDRLNHRKYHRNVMISSLGIDCLHRVCVYIRQLRHYSIITVKFPKIFPHSKKVQGHRLFWYCKYKTLVKIFFYLVAFRWSTLSEDPGHSMRTIIDETGHIYRMDRSPTLCTASSSADRKKYTHLIRHGGCKQFK